MKLVHQINLAFGISLLLVLSFTAIVIHYVLLDHFIGTQKEDLRTMGAAMTSALVLDTTEPADLGSVFTSDYPVTMPQMHASIEAIVADENGRIVSGSVPSMTQFGVGTSLEVNQMSSLQNLWDGTDGRYIVEVSAIPQGTLTLLAPVSKIKAIEQALLGRLLLIFAVGGFIMFLLSLFVTKRLIKPLMRLREELKKVKERQFSNVQLIKAGGEIGAVAQTVFEMADELNRYSHVQKQFFQNASHELKTPLMSISGYAEGIRDGVFEGESVGKGLDIIVSESGRLKNIVSEMTLLAKLDSEEDIFRSTDVDMKELLLETVERINPLLVSRSLILHTACNEQETLAIRADRDKLLQALLNVVSNATRYANKHIYIHAAVNRGRIEISVADDGSGIAKELLPYLFHRFVKGKDGESGLGLAISRAIVERCGGTIAAGNRKEGGAIISLGFPAISL